MRGVLGLDDDAAHYVCQTMRLGAIIFDLFRHLKRGWKSQTPQYLTLTQAGWSGINSWIVFHPFWRYKYSNDNGVISCTSTRHNGCWILGRTI